MNLQLPQNIKLNLKTTLFMVMVVWTKKKSGAPSVNKGCWGHQAVSHCHCPQQHTLRGSRTEKNRILALDGAYRRRDFSELRLLYLSIQKKALNSLPWDVWFALISSNPLMFGLPCFVAKTPVYPSPSFTSSEQFLRVERLCPVLKSSESRILNFQAVYFVSFGSG